jgi:hypothetical protein
MTKTEEKFQDFLSEYGICCDTCRMFNKNAKRQNVKSNACVSERNKQATVYESQYFTPINDSFMCEQWSDIEEQEDK